MEERTVSRQKIMPTLAMRGLVIFEGMQMHFDVGRKRSIEALMDAMSTDKHIFLVTQKDAMVEDPKKEDLYEYGVVAVVKQMLKTQDGVMRVLVQGEHRARLIDVMGEEPFLETLVEHAPLSMLSL